MTMVAPPGVVDLAIDRALGSITAPAVRVRLVSSVRAAIDALDEGRVQTVVFAARRMLCLYAVMRQHGLAAPTSGEVVSDRFLEVLPDLAWRGHTVLLVDDTRITGATLSTREATLHRLVGAEGVVETDIALEPPEWAQTAVERRDWLQQETGGDFHAQCAAVFGQNLLPYFTDFAMSTILEMGSSDLAGILTAEGWQSVDVTNHAVAGSGVRAFSLFPGSAARRRLTEYLGDADLTIEVAKVRVFVNQSGARARLRLVPVVLLVPFDRGAVDAFLEDIEGVPSSADAAREQLVGVLTYDLSRRLLEFVFAEFRGHLPVVQTNQQEDEGHRRLILGPANRHIGTDWPWHSLVAGPTAAQEADELVDGSTPLLIGDDHVARLLDWFSNLSAGDPDEARRDREGFDALQRHFESSPADLSIALDIGNDLGTVVPGQLSSDGLIRRAYRPGETKDLRTRIAPMGGRWASVQYTVRLDDRLRPLDWSETTPAVDDDGGPRR